MQPSHSPAHQPGEADPDTLAALLDSSRRLSLFWPAADRGPGPGAAPSRPITVPARARALVAAMPEYGG